VRSLVDQATQGLGLFECIEVGTLDVLDQRDAIAPRSSRVRMTAGIDTSPLLGCAPAALAATIS